MAKRWPGCLLIVLSLPAMADCPPGQMPGHDAFGNRACLSVETRQPVMLEPAQEFHCAPGYKRTLDALGRWVCQDKTSDRDARPRRSNCPPGTWLSKDAWGYERCVPVP